MKPPPLPPQRPAEPAPVAEVRPVRSVGSVGRVGQVRPVRRGPRATLFRLAMFGICAASIGLLYWSLFVRFLPISNEHQASLSEMSRLSGEVEQLRSRLDPVEAKRTRTRYEAARQLLFQGTDDIERWSAMLERDALSKALDVEVALGGPWSEDGTELARVEAELTLWPMTVLGLTNSPYHRVLGYFQDVVNAPKRIDLLELRVDGNSNSIEYAHAVFQVMSADHSQVNGREATP